MPDLIKNYQYVINNQMFIVFLGID